MKDISRVSKWIATFSLLSLVGCSYLQSRSPLFDEQNPEAAPKAATSVPKEQYDQLLVKYEALQTRLQTLEAGVESTPPAQQMDSPPGEILGALQNAKDSELAETVDVFAATTTVAQSENYDNVDVEGQIRNLQTADALVSQNKFNEAISILKELEKSPVRQVRVRARYLVGESMFKQGDFDLSMQIFEEIIQKDAFSGMVLKALGRLIVCTEKLKLDKKKEQYYSLLHDFFES